MPADYRQMILATLRLKGPMGSNEIARELGASRDTIYGHTKRMFAAGIIESASGPDAKRDRRYRIVERPVSSRRASAGSGQVTPPSYRALLCREALRK